MAVVLEGIFERVLVVGPYKSEWIERFLSRGVSFVTAENPHEVEKCMDTVQAVFIYSPFEQPVSSDIKLRIHNRARRLKIARVVIQLLPDTLVRDLNACLNTPPSAVELAAEPMSDFRFVESVAPKGWKFKPFDYASSIRRKAKLAGRTSLGRNDILRFLKQIREARMREAGVDEKPSMKVSKIENRFPPGVSSEITNAKDVEIPVELVKKALRSACASSSSFIKRIYRAEYEYSDFEWSKAIWKLAVKNGFPALEPIRVYSEIQTIKRNIAQRRLNAQLNAQKEEQNAS